MYVVVFSKGCVCVFHMVKDLNHIPVTIRVYMFTFCHSCTSCFAAGSLSCTSHCAMECVGRESIFSRASRT